MRKYIVTILLCLLCCRMGMAQSLKSVSILGDSYSTFEDYLQPDTNLVWYWRVPPKPDRTDVTSVTQTWWHRFIKENNFRLCVNNSFSGSTICNSGYKRGKPNFTDYSDRSFITRMKYLGCPDIIFVFGGTNDSWAGSPIGEYKYGGWTKEDLFSFRPAMAYLLAEMKERYPNVEIYFLLNDGLKAAIDESVKTICAHYGIDCIELKGISKMSGHPSAEGMKQINGQVNAYLKNSSAR